MSLGTTTVTIAGGGVAGLAAATALARAGARVSLYERAPAITEVGAGLQISSNGMRALGALGLDHAVSRVAVASEGTRLIDGLSNKPVLEIPASPGAVFVHRARLIEVLTLGASDAGARLVTGAEVAPDSAEGDVILGADGVRSAFRSTLNPGTEPKYSGQVAWRAVIHDPNTPPVAEVYMGPGRHLVTYPLAGGLRNIVACEDRNDWTAEGWAIEDRPMNLRAGFARFPDHVQAWLAQVHNVYLWGLFLHPVAERWTDGRMVLLGDAAHPTLPYLAQGANLALEDAVVLARALTTGDLEAYETHRRARAKAVVAAAAANAWKFHLANGLARQAAFGALRLREAMSLGATGKSLSWVWNYDPVTAPL
ncbi:MAG: FAD-dependent monooxygenase [Pseudomonadota bacterium]